MQKKQQQPPRYKRICNVIFDNKNGKVYYFKTVKQAMNWRKLRKSENQFA